MSYNFDHNRLSLTISISLSLSLSPSLLATGAPARHFVIALNVVNKDVRSSSLPHLSILLTITQDVKARGHHLCLWQAECSVYTTDTLRLAERLTKYSLIPHLYNNSSYRLRLAVNSSSSKDRLSKQYPNAEVVQVDLNEPPQVRDLVKDANIFYHVGIRASSSPAQRLTELTCHTSSTGPAFHPHETQIGYHVIDACVASSSISHFIYSSVLNTQLRKLLNHDCKRYVEEYLIESGLNYTILQPTNFMDNMKLEMFLSQPEDDTIYHAPWNPDVAFSQIALRDLGEAAANVVKEGEKHYFAQYLLVSTRPTPYREVVKIVGQGIGRDIKVQQLPFEKAVEGFLKMLGGGKDVPWGTKDAAERMLLYYNHHGLWGNPGVLEMLLGRKATSVGEWTEVQLKAWKESQKDA